MDASEKSAGGNEEVLQILAEGAQQQQKLEEKALREKQTNDGEVLSNDENPNQDDLELLKMVAGRAQGGGAATAGMPIRSANADVPENGDLDLLKVVAGRAQRGGTAVNADPASTKKVDSSTGTSPKQGKILMKNLDGPTIPASGETADVSATDDSSTTPSQQEQSLARDSSSSRPGAYRHGDSSRVFAGAPARPSIQSSDPPSLRMAPSSIAPAPAPEQPVNAVSNLVEADKVPDEEDLENARPVDPEEAQKRFVNERKEAKTMFFWGVGWLAITIALVIGLVVVFKGQDSANDTSNVVPPTGSPTTAVTTAPTAAPTAVLDPLKDTLPTHTKQSLGVFGSPQQKAWNWLENHPNITGLPLWRQTQMFALVTFYYSFEGPHWRKEIRDRWLLYEKHECLWFSSGFGYFSILTDEYVEETGDDLVPSCNNNSEFVNLHVEKLELAGRFPVIPPEIELLTSLERIEFPLNSINVSFSSLWPSTPFTMENVTHLTLWANDLSGSIPEHLGQQLPNLEKLHLLANHLTGSLPSELFLLTNMIYLGIQQSSLSGTLPSELALMTKLEELLMDGNRFTGTIPRELGLMTQLEVIDLNKCQLSGSIPTEVGELLLLEKLFLADNGLGNSIPSQLGLATSLEQLQLQNNFLSGTIPFELDAVPGLKLGGNQFTGQVPSHLCGKLSCACSGNVSSVSTCLYLEKEPEWPGRVPAATANEDGDEIAVMINIKTDLWPEETSWVWQEESDTGDWIILKESGGFLESVQFLHSYPVALGLSSRYNLTVSDKYSDGLLGSGFITLTDSNERVLFSVIARESIDVVDPRSNFAELTVLVSVNATGSVEVIESMT